MRLHLVPDLEPDIQRGHFAVVERLARVIAALEPVDVDLLGFQINVVQRQADRLGDAQAVMGPLRNIRYAQEADRLSAK